MNPGSPEMFGIALMAMWGTAGAVALGRSAAKSPAMRELAAAVRKMNLTAKGALVAGLVGAVAIGGTKPGGTNNPPRGLRSPPATVAVEPSFAPVEVSTNNVTLRAESSSAVEVGDWRKHGSSSGGVWLDFEEPVFRIGTNPVFRAHVAASGAVSFDSMRRPPVGAPLPDGTGISALAPLLAPLGMVPEANWTNAGAASRFWHDSAPGRGRVLTWEEALLDRQPGRRVSVQAELLSSGDFTYRYDFADALDPPATNLVIGGQIGTNGVNALAILGSNTLAATVWRVDGARVTNGVSIADLLCTNGVLRTPARFAIEWKNTSGIDPTADTDNDGLSDWDEVFRHGTDPNQADTDGDGLSDSAEVLAGANPLDADEDGDGIPDGVPQATWESNPLWEMNSPTGRTIRISVISPLSSPATFVFGGLSIPLRENGCWTLSLEKGTLYSFRLFTRGEAVRLSIEPGEETPSLRGTAVFPLRSGTDDEDDGFWLDDPTDAFGAGSIGGEGGMAFPEIVLALPQGIPLNGNHLVGDDICVHSQDGIARLEWSLAPDTDGSMDKQVVGEGLIVSGNYLALRIPPGEDSASGTVSIAGLRWGAISKTIAAHRFQISPNGSYCEGCGHYVPNDVSISLSTNSLVLKHDDLLSLTMSHPAPSGVEFSDYRFEIRRQGTSTWQTLGTGRSLNWTARIAGTFEIRGTLEAGGMRGESSIGTVEVRFPAWNQIAADATVSSAIQSAWDLTLSDCTETPENRAREWAFWVLLDTRTGTYSTTTPVHGDWVAFGNGGDVDPDDPPLDIPLNPTPVSNGATYCVAGFHTHTPICYDPNPGWRLAGPSTGLNGDFAAAQQYGMPGLLWDYEPDEPATGRLHTGHNINAPSRLYPVIPPERRPTP